MSSLNEFGQPIGFPVPDWRPATRPPREPIEGRLCRLEPLDPDRHAKELHEAYALDPDVRHWTYLREGPFESFEAFAGWLERQNRADDALVFAIRDRAVDRAVGVASLLHVDPDNGTIEVGSLRFSSLLQRKPAATEAMFLLMRRVFELGYRRYEWKCDALNAASRAAAQRLGFRFEGIFRQARLNKGRNRDTAWFSLLDREWPALRPAFERWLDPANFDANGKQRARLSELTAAAQRGL
jgi:RimJ/RimL family protein N-acetyltransferase